MIQRVKTQARPASGTDRLLRKSSVFEFLNLRGATGDRSLTIRCQEWCEFEGGMERFSLVDNVVEQ